MDIIEAFKSVQRINTVYGTNEPEAYRVARTYRALRQRGEPAATAFKRAHSIKPLYPTSGGNIGAPFGDGLRWIENTEAAGLRFVGFADELAPRRIDHRGWLTDTEGFGNTLRGAVYQLPARGGRPLYVAAYREGENGRAGWSDLNGGAVLAFGDTFEGFSGGTSYYTGEHDDDGARDAASRADRIAERQAESERECNEAWQAGAEWARLGDDIADSRRAALAILKERRAVALPPAMCAAVRGKVESLLEAIADARRQRAALVDRYSASPAAGWFRDGFQRLADAFNDGACERIATVS